MTSCSVDLFCYLRVLELVKCLFCFILYQVPFLGLIYSNYLVNLKIYETAQMAECIDFLSLDIWTRV